MAQLSELTEWERDLMLIKRKDLSPLTGTPWVSGPSLGERRDDQPFSHETAVEYRVIPGNVQANDLVMSHLSSNFDRTPKPIFSKQSRRNLEHVRRHRHANDFGAKRSRAGHFSFCVTLASPVTRNCNVMAGRG